MPTTPRYILVIAVLALAIASGFVFIRGLVDFPVYYSAGQSLIHGRTDLYAPDFALGRTMDYRYPPFFLVALTPLWHLSYPVAAFIWHIVSILCIAAIIRFAAPLLGHRPVPWFVIVTSALTVTQYYVMILHYGNAQLLAVSCALISFCLLARGRSGWAAALMALSIATKLTPVLLVPYFALKRKWAYLAGVSSLLVVLLAAPSLVFGPAKNAQLLSQWFDQVILEQQFHEENGPINLAVKGEMLRYLTEVDYAKRIDGDTEYPAVNVISLPADRVSVAGIVAACFIWIACFGWLALRDRSPGRTDSESSAPAGRLDPLEFGLMICAMLLAGPLTSKIYFIALLWPVVFLADYCAYPKSGTQQRIRYLLIACAVTGSVLPLLPGRTTQRLLLVTGVDFFLTWLLSLALVFALREASRPARLRSGELQKERR